MTFPGRGLKRCPARRDHYAGPVDDAAEVARRCAETMYAQDKVAQDLAMEIAEIAPGRARVRMAVAETMVNGFGIAHGGYVFLLADSAFAYACNTHDAVTVAASADVVFVASARSGTSWRRPRPNACATAAAGSTT